MTVSTIDEVEFGDDLPELAPDVTLENVRQFVSAAGWDGPRFTSHEAARELGLPGAIVPGVMSQGMLGAMIHTWAPAAEIVKIDTVFRAPVLVDQAHTIKATVTDIDTEAGTVELDLTVANEASETRVFGTATVRLPSGE